MLDLIRHRLFKMATSTLLSVLLLFVSTVGPASAQVSPKYQYPVDDTEEIIDGIYTGDRWIDHLNNDLLPFWTMPTAFGDPVGNYPTYRCNDGSLYDPLAPCSELANADIGIVKLDREYFRAKSRQIFAYGVAYHLTGNSDYLSLAKAGADYLIDNGLAPEGGAYTYIDENGVGQPTQPQRISQDMAYAVAGLGFYYYLTRDAEVLAHIIALKDYIFDTYFDEEWDLLAWSLESYDDGGTAVSKDQRELVSQLDQVYGYMLLLDPILPDNLDDANMTAIQPEWEEQLVHLAQIMMQQFFSPDKGFFFGAITDPEDQQLGTDHTDFGHTVKTLWLIYEIGKLTGHYEFVHFTQEAIPKIFELAYLEDGSWGRRINGEGQLETDKEWWILAELDQTAATFSLRDPSYGKYLTTTYDYWFNHMVDKEHGGIWHWVNASDNLPDLTQPKQHSWKNAFHTFEHTLVGYITGQAIHNLPVTLYYAFEQTPENVKIRPYLFGAKIHSMTEAPMPGIITARSASPCPETGSVSPATLPMPTMQQTVHFVDVR